MSTPFLDKSRFTRDKETPSFAIYEPCRRCGKRTNADELTVGYCQSCFDLHMKELEAEPSETIKAIAILTAQGTL